MGVYASLSDEEIPQCVTPPLPVHQVKLVGAKSPLVKLTFSGASPPSSVKLGYMYFQAFRLKERELKDYTASVSGLSLPRVVSKS